MTNQKDENLTTEETITQDTDLENMLENAKKEADEAQADFGPLLNKIKELETQLQEKEEIARNSQIAYLNLKADFDILQRQTQQKIETADRDAVLKVVKICFPLLKTSENHSLIFLMKQKLLLWGKDFK